jgi:hypothetical protein
MSILSKGTDFGATEQVTSAKLDNLVDNAKFTNFSAAAVNYTGSTGTCLQGGGLEVTSNGQLQLQDGETDLVKLSTALKDSIHPVGIILETTQESTASAFQTKIGFGTWEAYGEGRVLVGFGQTTDTRGDTVNFNSIGDTSGEFQHLNTSAESGVPAHTHGGIFPSGGSGSFSQAFDVDNPNNGADLGSEKTTSANTAADASAAHNNMQPYIVVYRYRRTA